jgi:transposase-like protein
MSTKNRIKMRSVNYYSDEFKESVVKEVLDGLICKEEARRRYGIKGKSAVLNWIRKFEGSKTRSMNKKNKTGKSLEELEAENARLKQELEIEQLRSRALNVMIDIAEDKFKIPIRKKSGAKQSKK